MATKDLAESGINALRYEMAAVAARDAARAACDARSEGRARTTLGQVYSTAGRFDEADEQARLAMDLGRSSGDPWTRGNAPNERGILALYENRHLDAETHLSQARDAFRHDANKPGEASALCNLSRVHLATGRVASAVELAKQGIAIYAEADTGLALRLANGKYALGLALTAGGQTVEARSVLTEALGVFQESRQQLWHGMTLFRLAEVHLADRRYAAAAANAEQALSVLHGIGGEWRRANVLTVLGRGLSALGQTDRARVCWSEALTVFESLGSPEAAEVHGLLHPAAVA